jgi:hypothetical protein
MQGVTRAVPNHAWRAGTHNLQLQLLEHTYDSTDLYMAALFSASTSFSSFCSPSHLILDNSSVVYCSQLAGGSLVYARAAAEAGLLALGALAGRLLLPLLPGGGAACSAARSWSVAMRSLCICCSCSSPSFLQGGWTFNQHLAPHVVCQERVHPHSEDRDRRLNRCSARMLPNIR